MKKFAIILLLASLLLTVTACGNKEETQTEATLESGIANDVSLSQGDPITTPEIGDEESEISSTPSDSNEEVSTPESYESDEEESQITQSQPEDESEESKEEFEENPKDDSAEETQENSKEESADQSQEESEDDTYISQEPIPNGPRPR